MTTGNILPLKGQLNFYLGKKEEKKTSRNLRVAIDYIKIKVKFI